MVGSVLTGACSVLSSCALPSEDDERHLVVDTEVLDSAWNRLLGAALLELPLSLGMPGVIMVLRWPGEHAYGRDLAPVGLD